MMSGRWRTCSEVRREALRQYQKKKWEETSFRERLVQRVDAASHWLKKARRELRSYDKSQVRYERCCERFAVRLATLRAEFPGAEIPRFIEGMTLAEARKMLKEPGWWNRDKEAQKNARHNHNPTSSADSLR
jgi:hypothetical protein